MHGLLLSALGSFGAKMRGVFGLEIGNRESQSNDDHGNQKVVDNQIAGPPCHTQFRKPVMFCLYGKKGVSAGKKPSDERLGL